MALKRDGAAFVWDANEPPWTVEEWAQAKALRARCPETAERNDHCPHPDRCSNVIECLDKIAWYLRYEHQILHPDKKAP